MNAKEEIFELKEETETLNKEPVKLNDDELEPASGGNAGSGQRFTVYASSMIGERITIPNMSPGDTVLTLKTRIFQLSKRHVPVDQQRIVFSGNPLENSGTLGEYGIVNDSTVQVIYMIRG